MSALSELKLPPPREGRDAVRDAYRVFRSMPEVRPSARLLSDVDASAKAEHSLERGDLVVMLYLAPHRLAGVVNTCPYSTKGCRAGCLFTAGRASFDAGINRARVARTAFLIAHPGEFSTILAHEIGRFRARYGVAVGIRLNGTSDIPWERVAPWLFSRFSDLQFYDYTKWPVGARTLPENYDLTYSVSERPVDLASGERFAVVFSQTRGQALPDVYEGVRVIDGDLSDARFREPRGVVVGLRAKGSMRGDRSGMVKDAPMGRGWEQVS